MSAYGLTNLGLRPRFMPAMSDHTSTCASQSGPAPMPIVGITSSRRHPLGDVRGHHLQHHRERPRRLQRQRVLDQALTGVAAALDPEPAERVLALRGEPEVGHHRDAGARQRLDLRREPRPALELDGVRPALLHEPEGGGQRLLGADLVAAERQVRDDERALRARVPRP